MALSMRAYLVSMQDGILGTIIQYVCTLNSGSLDYSRVQRIGALQTARSFVGII